MLATEYVRKYFVMGSQDCDREPERILMEAIDAGITAFQFREKGKDALTGDAKIALGKNLRAICHEHKIPFFINDDVELASVLNVDGIHVGQDDESIATLRSKFPKLQIGLSISNEKELKQSPLHLVDYVGAGPIYATSSKADAKEAVGLKWITFLRNKHPRLPIVAIGGINEHNAAQIIKAGANGVAVISAITKANNIHKVVQSL